MRLAQHILIRTDLGFSPGLYAAQISHLHAEVFRRLILDQKTKCILLDTLSSPSLEFKEWVKSPYVFIRAVSNPEILNHFIDNAQEIADKSSSNILIETWKDTVVCRPAEGLEFILHCLIGASFGPIDDDVAKLIGLSRLPLFNG